MILEAGRSKPQDWEAQFWAKAETLDVKCSGDKGDFLKTPRFPKEEIQHSRWSSFSRTKRAMRTRNPMKKRSFLSGVRLRLAEDSIGNLLHCDWKQ